MGGKYESYSQSGKRLTRKLDNRLTEKSGVRLTGKSDYKLTGKLGKYKLGKLTMYSLYEETQTEEFVRKRERNKRIAIILVSLLLFVLAMYLIVTWERRSDNFIKIFHGYDMLNEQEVEVEVNMWTTVTMTTGNAIKGSISTNYPANPELNYSKDFTGETAFNVYTEHMETDFPEEYNEAYKTEAQLDLGTIGEGDNATAYMIFSSLYWDPGFQKMIFYGEGFEDDGDILIVASEDADFDPEEIYSYFELYIEDEKELRQAYQ